MTDTQPNLYRRDINKYVAGTINYYEPVTCDHGSTEAHADKSVGVRVGGDYPMCPGGLAANLAGVSELADRYQVQPNTVAVWTQRHQDFPEPLLQVGGRVRVWWVPEVDEWYNQRQR